MLPVLQQLFDIIAEKLYNDDYRLEEALRYQERWKYMCVWINFWQIWASVHGAR